MERLRVGVDKDIEQNEEGKERDAGGVEQHSLIEYRCHLAVKGNKGRGGGEDAVYFQKGNGFGAALRYDERVLQITGEGEGQDDVEFDRSDEEEFGHLSAVDGENGMSYFGEEGSEVAGAAGLFVQQGVIAPSQFQCFGAASRTSSTTGHRFGRPMSEIATVLCSGWDARGGGCRWGRCDGSLAHGRR